jgi:hypothetical protein
MKPLSFSTPSSDDVVVEALGDELLIYDRRTDVAHCVGSVATLVWRTCDGGASLDEIARQIVARGIASAGEDAIEVARAAVSELEDKGLLESHGVGADGVSRRHALRQMAGVGAAAVVAPLVVSAAVPKSAAAFGSPPTCRTTGQTCTPPGSTNATNTCCTGSATASDYCTAGGICAACFAPNTTPTPACPGGNNMPNFACCSGFCGNGSNASTCL